MGIKTTYTSADLSLQNDTASGVRQYGNDIAQVIMRNVPTTQENELSMLERGLQGDESAFKDLDAIIENYRTIVEEALALPVPKSAVSVHLKLINSLATTAGVVAHLRNVSEDPLGALVALEQYPDAGGKVIESFQGLASFFSTKQIVFVAGEPWHTFVNSAPQ